MDPEDNSFGNCRECGEFDCDRDHDNDYGCSGDEDDEEHIWIMIGVADNNRRPHD